MIPRHLATNRRRRTPEDATDGAHGEPSSQLPRDFLALSERQRGLGAPPRAWGDATLRPTMSYTELETRRNPRAMSRNDCPRRQRAHSSFRSLQESLDQRTPISPPIPYGAAVTD
jgi:hypothetical protein